MIGWICEVLSGYIGFNKSTLRTENCVKKHSRKDKIEAEGREQEH